MNILFEQLEHFLLSILAEDVRGRLPFGALRMGNRQDEQPILLVRGEVLPLDRAVVWAVPGAFEVKPDICREDDDLCELLSKRESLRGILLKLLEDALELDRTPDANISHDSTPGCAVAE